VSVYTNILKQQIKGPFAVTVALAFVPFDQDDPIFPFGDGFGGTDILTDRFCAVITGDGEIVNKTRGIRVS
jgi:hypothetical protein